MSSRKAIKQITVHDLKKIREENKKHRLIDVRNKDEYEYCNIDGELIPMQEISERYTEIDKVTMTVIHCHHGGRSQKVIAWLQDNYGYENLYNLEGGINAWSTEIDSTISIY